MADPTVAGNNTEFQRVAKAAAALEDQVTAYSRYKDLLVALQEAKQLLRESDGELMFASSAANCHMADNAAEDQRFVSCRQIQKPEKRTISSVALGIWFLGDQEMAELAREEVETLSAELTTLTQELKILLLPRDPLDEKNVMLEVNFYCPCAECRAVNLFLVTRTPSTVLCMERA